MNKKIFMLLFFLLVLMSMSAISAADMDDNNDTVVLSDDAEILSAANDVDAIGDLNGTVGAVVNENNFFNYFDESGTLLPNAPGELTFEGDFSDLNLNYITIDVPVKFTGNDAVFDDIAFVITSDNVVIDGFTVSQNSDIYAFSIFGASDVTLSNNIIEFTALEGFDSYAVYAAVVQNFNLINNYISYLGNTDGTVFNNAVRIEGDDDEDGPVPASSIVVSGNTFDLKIPSVDVGYNPDTWASMVMNEGIVFYFCENLEFVDNRIDLKYNEFKTQWGFDSLYAISATSDPYTFGEIQSNYIKIADNTINIEGHAYVYAISLCADNLNVTGNTITATAETNLAHGIDINGPSQTGIVSKNNINVESPSSSYGIYSYQYMGAIEDIVYSGNTVNVTGYASVGMKIVECNPEITGNVIVANGNYTDGIVAKIRDEGEVTGNIITVLGSNIGKDSTGDPLMPMNSIGISVNGDLTIEGNTIESTNIGIILFEGSKFTINDNNIKVETNSLINSYGIYSPSLENLKYITITDNTIYTTCEYSVNIANATGTVNSNYLISEKFLGDDSVCYNGSVSVYSNTPILVSDLVKVYGVNQSLIVFAVDEDGIPMSNVTLIATIGSIQFEATTDDNGQAGFLFEKLTPGNYTANIGFNNIYVGAVATTNVVVIIGESVITAPDVTKYYGGPEKLEITLIEKDLDVPIVGVNVTIKIDGGNDIIKTTDSEGKAYVDLDLNVGDYNAKVSYQNKNVEVKITVNKYPTDIALENVTMALKVNDNVSSGATLTPTDAGNLTYTSSNSSVVTVMSGIIVPVGVGQAIITVSFAGNENYAAAENRTINVTVTAIDASVSVNNITIDLKIDENFTIVATTVPEGLKVIYVNDNSGVVSVDENGTVTALKGGVAHIIVKVGGDGVYALNTTNVTVYVGRVHTEIIVAKDTLDLKVLENFTAGAALIPADAGNLTYTSSNPNVAIVKDGIIRAIGLGNATITVSFAGNDKYVAAENRTINVTVTAIDASVSVNNITIDLKIDENFTIVATTVPEGLKVTYVNDNSGVVSVDENGTVTALKAGNATIIVKVGGDGVYALNTTNVAVTVSKVPTEISIAKDTLDLKVLENFTAGATLTPAGAGNLTYTIRDSSVVKVENGTIKAIGAGNTTITVSFAGDDKYEAAENRTINVTVRLKDVIVNVNNSIVELIFGESFTIIATTVPEGLNLTYVVDDSGIVSVDENGTVTTLKLGIAKVLVKFDGDDVYAANSTVVTVKVKIDKVIISPEGAFKFTSTENGTQLISVKLPKAATGFVLLNIKGTQTHVPLENGAANITLPKLAEGTYSVIVTYTGDDWYAPVSATKEINVTSNVPESAMAIPKISKSDAPSTYSISLPSDAGGFLEVEVDGTIYSAPLSNGSASVTIPALSDGSHNVTVRYTGDENYSPVTQQTTLNVSAPVFKLLNNADVSALYSAKATYKVLVTRDGEAVGADEEVTFTYNGKTYTVRTDKNGYATLNLKTKVKVNKYTITATYKGVTVTNNVTVNNIIKAKNKKVKKSKKVTKVKVSLNKVNGKYLKNKVIKIKFNGKSYIIVTNKKGVATWKVKKSMLKKLKKGKKYKYTVTYGKDTVTKKLTIKK